MSIALLLLTILSVGDVTLTHGWGLSTCSQRRGDRRFARTARFTINQANLHHAIKAEFLSPTSSSRTEGRRGLTQLDALLSSEATKTTERAKIPLHLLAGFLGAGKTSVLKHILENSEGLSLGVIVNDVAAVNIDAKLVQQQQQQKQQKANSDDATGTTGTTTLSSSVSSATSNPAAQIIELKNGCVCCSLADDLFTSLERLLTSQSNSSPLDAIVVELSGVADPVALTNQWNQVVQQPSSFSFVTDALHIGNVITVVDASTFGTDYMTSETAGDRTEWWWTSGGGTNNNNNGGAEAGCTVNRQVVELLAEQVEAANVIVLNKQDLASRTPLPTCTSSDAPGTTASQMDVVRSMVQSLNDQNATVISTTYGKVPSVAQLLVMKPPTATANAPMAADNDDASRITHEATTASSSSSCGDPDCSDASHVHSHAHHDQHHHNAETSMAQADAAACQDADCNDPTHSHSHSHSHATEKTSTSSTDTTSTTTSLDNLGISSFVYRATRPFNAHRLMQILYQWPVPIKDELDLNLLQEAAQEGYSIKGGSEKESSSPFVNILRSKGFCWLAPVSWLSGNNDFVSDEADDSWRHDTTMYWSQAGRHLGMTEAGRWWSSVESTETMRNFFAHDPVEYERMLREDFVTEEFGDRRQELVFIGVAVQEAEIRQTLDDCLLTEDEMKAYRRNLQATIQMPIEQVIQ